MPEMPVSSDGGISSSWIIGTVLGMLGAVVATVVTMAKFIQGGYAQTIVDLKEEVKTLKIETKALDARCDILTEESAKCREDRASLGAQLKIFLEKHNA